MGNVHHWLRKNILTLVDFFYPPFRSFMPLQLFRYAVCGGGNMALAMLLYPIFYNFVFQKEIVHIPFTAISAHIATLIANFFITFPIGFYLSLYVVFPGSYLKRRVQLLRYFFVAMLNLLLNYLLMKLFVDVFHWFPTPSYWLTVAVVVTFTYLVQRSFTFRKRKEALSPYDNTLT